MMNQPEGPRPPSLSYVQLFLRFLRFGLLAFGGPVAQIAMIRRDLVEGERWISSAGFNRLLAVMQVLPGPEAHELCVHLGIRARGRIGGLLAGLGFMLPGFVLMMAVAAAYVAFAPSHDLVAGAFLGIQIAVIALIVRAVYGIGKHVLEDRVLWSLACVAVVASLLGVSFWVVLAASAATCPLVRSRRWGWLAVAGITAVGAGYLLHPTTDQTVAASVLSADAGAASLLWTGLKAGLLTFGGAYTVIPYVRADTVGRDGFRTGRFWTASRSRGCCPHPW